MEVYVNGKVYTGILLETKYEPYANSTEMWITFPGYIKGFDGAVILKDSDKFSIKKVIFNAPATIVLWGDGTKTVVKCQGRRWCRLLSECIDACEEYNKEFGLAMCIAKKALGNKGNYYNEFKKWLKDDGEND